MQHEKTISGFPVSRGSPEALVRCGGKIKYILIAHFFRNVFAKNCRNQTVYVKIIASCKSGTFFETQCSMFTSLVLHSFIHCVHLPQVTQKACIVDDFCGILYDEES